MCAVHAIPEGYHSITPALVCKNAAKAIDYYKEVFQAKELGRMIIPGGAIGHAELQIGDSRLMLSDEFPGIAQAPAPIPSRVVRWSSIQRMSTRCSTAR
jgi:PhnB protein